MSKKLGLVDLAKLSTNEETPIPSCFRKVYPKVRCIISCFECFTETPSGLNLAAAIKALENKVIAFTQDVTKLRSKLILSITVFCFLGSKQLTFLGQHLSPTFVLAFENSTCVFVEVLDSHHVQNFCIIPMSADTTSFPGSFISPPQSRSLWAGEMKDPGNEVAADTVCSGF